MQGVWKNRGKKMAKNDTSSHFYVYFLCMHWKHNPQQRSNTLSRGRFHCMRHQKTILETSLFPTSSVDLINLWVIFSHFLSPSFCTLVFPFFPVSWHIFMWWHISIHQFWRAIRESCRLPCVIHYSTELISCPSLTMSVSSERWDYMRDTPWGATCFRYCVFMCRKYTTK